MKQLLMRFEFRECERIDLDDGPEQIGVIVAKLPYGHNRASMREVVIAEVFNPRGTHKDDVIAAVQELVHSHWVMKG